MVLGFFALMVMATWFQDVFGLESRLNALVVGRRAVVRGHPGHLHAVAKRRSRAVPRSYVEASTALGAARWQTIARVVLPAASPGHRRRRRAGPRPRRRRDDDRADGVGQRRHRLGQPRRLDAHASSATIAAELAEVVFGGAHYTVLFFLGTLLFLVTFGINSVGDWAIRRMKRKLGSAT